MLIFICCNNGIIILFYKCYPFRSPVIAPCCEQHTASQQNTLYSIQFLADSWVSDLSETIRDRYADLFQQYKLSFPFTGTVLDFIEIGSRLHFFARIVESIPVHRKGRWPCNGLRKRLNQSSAKVINF